jgi:chromosome segregation ATPase
MLLVLGFLLFANDFPGNVLGAATALFVVGLLKVASELAVTSTQLREDARASSHSSDTMKKDLTQLKEDSTQLKDEVTLLKVMLSATEERLTRESERVEGSTRALHDQMSSVRAGLIEALGGIKEAEHRGKQNVEVLRADINARLIAHAEALKELIEAQKPVRRHRLYEAFEKRELGLGESLDALSRGRLEPENHGGQVSGSNEPEAGGSISTNG